MFANTIFLNENINVKQLVAELIQNPNQILTKARIGAIPQSNVFYGILADSAVTDLDVDLRVIDANEQKEFFINLPCSLLNRLKEFRYNGRSRDPELFKTITLMISQCPRLSKVDLFCPLYSELLADMLASNHSIEILNLASCYLGDAGAKILAKGILKNTSLTKLNFTNNGFKEDGSTEIVRAVATQGKITSLSLRTNKISTNELSEIVHLLIPNKTLTHLDLNYVRMDNEGATLIAKLIKNNTSITKLKLNRCKIGEVGVAYITDALHTCNPCERFVDLSLNVAHEDNKKIYPITLPAKKISPLSTLNLLAKDSDDKSEIVVSNENSFSYKK